MPMPMPMSILRPVLMKDYDIISGAEEEDPVSDFEVLSAVSTNN